LKIRRFDGVFEEDLRRFLYPTITIHAATLSSSGAQVAQPLFYQFRYICQACQRCMLQIPMFFCTQETWLMERGISAVLSEPRFAPPEEQKADGMWGCNCVHFVHHASRVSFINVAMPLHSGTSWRRCTISNRGQNIFYHLRHTASYSYQICSEVAPLALISTLYFKGAKGVFQKLSIAFLII